MSRPRLARAPVLGPVLPVVGADRCALRAALRRTAASPLVLAPGGRPSGLPGLLVLVGVLGLVGGGAAARTGPARRSCSARAELAWAVRYGDGRPAGAADAAARRGARRAPPGGGARRGRCRRPPGWTVRCCAASPRHGGLVLALSAAVAVLALGVARPGGSVPLELAGLAAAVLVAAVPVLLALGGRPADRPVRDRPATRPGPTRRTLAGYPRRMADRPHILIVGGGYVGMYTALRLQKRLRRGEARITVVDPQNYMTYQPFLPETAAGSLEPRHVVVPLRKVLRRCRVLTGMVTGIDHARKVARLLPVEGPEEDIPYDVIVVAPGSVVRTLPIPGLAEHGHRLQDRRRGDLPAQPRAVPAGLRRVRAGRGAPAAGADLRVHRRRVRRDRGVRRAGGHGPLRDPLLRHRRARPTCAGCWSRRPGGSCPRSACRCRSTRCASCSSAAWTSGSTPGSSRLWTVTSCSATARSSTPRPSCGPPGSRPTRCCARTDLPLDAKGRLRLHARSCGWPASRTPGAPATAPRCRT